MHLENFKLFAVTPPAAIVDNAGLTTAEIDTKGFEYVRVIVALGALDIAMTALKIQESDTSGSGFADVPGLTYGTSIDIDGSTSALPTASNDNGFFVFDLDLRGRKRYLDVVATCGDGSTGTYITILAMLMLGDALPHGVAGHGAAGMLKL